MNGARGLFSYKIKENFGICGKKYGGNEGAVCFIFVTNGRTTC